MAQEFTSALHSRLSCLLDLGSRLGRNIWTYSDLEQNYLADALLRPCVFITWGATQASVNTILFISRLDLLSPTCFCPLLLFFHILKYKALPHFTIFTAATLWPAKINSKSRDRRGVSNKSIPFLCFKNMTLSHWRDSSCCAGAAQQTFNSSVCCSETIGCIQLLWFDAVWRHLKSA